MTTPQQDAVTVFYPFLLCSTTFLFFMTVGMWRVFVKAGKPGWLSLVPLYNIVVLFDIADMGIVFIAALFLPGFNLMVYMLLCGRLAGVFDRGRWFAVGLFFFPMFFLPVLGFDGSKYDLYPSLYSRRHRS